MPAPGSSGDGPADPARARQARLVAIVIAATALLWMAAQWLGGAMGWQARYAVLFDLAALAAFAWAMIATWRLWRQRQE
jgi:hypothetical protein